MVCTALGIIQYWEGTPHRVLISVLIHTVVIMSGSEIVNHPLRDEPGLKTKQINDHPRSSVNTREVSEGSMIH